MSENGKGARRPEVPRRSNKYAWLVAILAFMTLGVILFVQTLPNSGAGLDGPARGSKLKVFAAPDALGRLEGDANVCQRRPCPERAGGVPACQVVSREVVNLCRLRRRPLVLTFIFDRGADCYPQVDRTERVRRELDGVEFATVFFSRKERDELRRLVRGERVAAAGGAGRGRRRGEPVRRGRLPAHGVRPPRRQGEDHAARQPHRGPVAQERGAASVTDLALDLTDGWVEPELAQEFPELGLLHAPVDAASGPTPPEVKRRLRSLADRYTGGRVIHMRQDPVPWAYRVFARQVGIDPDSDRTPVEAIALERLRHGGLRSENLLDDALTIAIAETGVPLVALDGDRVGDDLGLRLAAAGESLGPARPLSARQIVIADRSRPVALVLGQAGDHTGVTPDTGRMVLCALGVKGVPRISVEEALWIAAETLVYT